jgi:lipopolysaccharide heptosyltransferase II
MATPLLRALRREHPNAVIHWLADATYAHILADNPLVDFVIAFDSKSWRTEFRYGQVVPYLRRSRWLRRELLAEHYDVVINLTAEKWWSLWFTVAPRRVGLFPRPRPGLMGRVYTDAIPRTIEPRLHNTRHYLLPAQALGIAGPYDERMVVGVSDSQRRAVHAVLQSDSSYVQGRPTVVLHPGTSQATKCWPIKHYAALAERLFGYNIAITGSSAEREIAERIASASHRGVLVAAGRLHGIGETAALIERSSAVVTGDTSVLHIASALDVPLIGIYGSTRPNDNAPLFGRSELLFDDSVDCAPCYHSTCRLANGERLKCLRQISVEQALAALERIGVQST